MTARYGIDERGRIVRSNEGVLVRYSDHLAEVGRLRMANENNLEGWRLDRAGLGRQIARLETEIRDWQNAATNAAAEDCGTERHCTCVGPLRAEVARLREALQDVHRLAGLATNACDDYDGMGRDPILGHILARQAMDRAIAALHTPEES